MKFYAQLSLPTFFLLALLISCNTTKESELYFQEMMEIHHQDMVVWGEIYGLKKTIKDELASMENMRLEMPEEVDSLKLKTYAETISQLESADEAMNVWMADFKAPLDKTEEEAMAYLKEEMEKMQSMGKEVADAVAAAKDLLNTNKE
ncbi:MAG: hypothetical protein R8P61_12140 [Bacteroidia bacterium]|nr:hypothetical protein [Bacteroidia bacterium]